MLRINRYLQSNNKILKFSKLTIVKRCIISCGIGRKNINCTKINHQNLSHMRFHIYMLICIFSFLTGLECSAYDVLEYIDFTTGERCERDRSDENYKCRIQEREDGLIDLYIPGGYVKRDECQPGAERVSVGGVYEVNEPGLPVYPSLYLEIPMPLHFDDRSSLELVEGTYVDIPNVTPMGSYARIAAGNGHCTVIPIEPYTGFKPVALYELESYAKTGWPYDTFIVHPVQYDYENKVMRAYSKMTFRRTLIESDKPEGMYADFATAEKVKGELPVGNQYTVTDAGDGSITVELNWAYIKRYPFFTGHEVWEFTDGWLTSDSENDPYLPGITVTIPRLEDEGLNSLHVESAEYADFENTLCAPSYRFSDYLGDDVIKGTITPYDGFKPAAIIGGAPAAAEDANAVSFRIRPIAYDLNNRTMRAYRKLVLRRGAQSGVSETATDNADDVYYTIDGRIEPSPAQGRVYIRCRAGRYEKVVF